jgi:uncharacterized membrane protein YesL
MAKKREFGEGPIYTALNYVMWGFASNFYFLICNSLLILYFIIFSGDIKNTAVLLYLATLPLAPALIALYATMGKIIRDKDVDVTSYYFKAYKSNFKNGFFLGFMASTLILISIIDIQYFSTVSFGNYIIPFFLFVILCVLLVSLYAFPLASRFYFKISDLIKLSFVYSIKKIHITFFNLSSIVCAFFIFYTIPAISIFFLFSATCYIIMNYEIKIFKELEEKIEVDKEQQHD